jgi:ribokinase
VPGANAAVTPEYIQAKREVIRSAGMVLAQLEIPLESVVRLAELCEQEDVPLMLDPAPAQELPPELLRSVRWFTPNESEAAFYASVNATDESASVASKLMQQEVRGVVLKLGERGAAIFDRDAVPISVASFAVKAVDSTAAGDTFNGAFAASLVAGRDVADAGRIASAAAAISVTRSGAQVSMPTWDEVEVLLRG